MEVVPNQNLFSNMQIVNSNIYFPVISKMADLDKFKTAGKIQPSLNSETHLSRKASPRANQQPKTSRNEPRTGSAGILEHKTQNDMSIYKRKESKRTKLRRALYENFKSEINKPNKANIYRNGVNNLLQIYSKERSSNNSSFVSNNQPKKLKEYLTRKKEEMLNCKSFETGSKNSNRGYLKRDFKTRKEDIKKRLNKAKNIIKEKFESRSGKLKTNSPRKSFTRVSAKTSTHLPNQKKQQAYFSLDRSFQQIPPKSTDLDTLNYKTEETSKISSRKSSETETMIKNVIPKENNSNKIISPSKKFRRKKTININTEEANRTANTSLEHTFGRGSKKFNFMEEKKAPSSTRAVNDQDFFIHQLRSYENDTKKSRGRSYQAQHKKKKNNRNNSIKKTNSQERFKSTSPRNRRPRKTERITSASSKKYSLRNKLESVEEENPSPVSGLKTLVTRAEDTQIPSKKPKKSPYKSNYGTKFDPRENELETKEFSFIESQINHETDKLFEADLSFFGPGSSNTSQADVHQKGKMIPILTDLERENFKKQMKKNSTESNNPFPRRRNLSSQYIDFKPEENLKVKPSSRRSASVRETLKSDFPFSKIFRTYLSTKKLYYVDNLLKSHKEKKSKKNEYQNHFAQSIQSVLYMMGVKPVDESEILEKKVYLPPQRVPGQKTLVFDLDETLIHCNDKLSDPCDYKIKIKFSKGEEIQAGIVIRPWARKCLKKLSKSFEIVIFTASHACYANRVLELLDPDNKYITYRLFRNHCVKTDDGIFVKDLRIFANRDLKNLIIVDNALYSYGLNLENGIPILPFYRNKKDFELRELVEFLLAVKDFEDLRIVVKDFFMIELYKKYNGNVEVLKQMMRNRRNKF